MMMNFCNSQIAALLGVVLELFGRAEQRPLQFGGRKVNAAPVSVGFVVVQAICTRTDDAAVDDDRFEVEVGSRSALHPGDP